jgi:uncharacterized integral membrane protein
VNAVWVIKGIIFLLLLFVLVYFFLNNNQTISLNLLGQIYDVALFWVLVLAYSLGFATSFILAAVREIRFHTQIRRLKGAIQQRDKEIVNLRTMPLQDLPSEDTKEESASG